MINRDSLIGRPILVVELVSARLICLPSNTGATNSARMTCLRSAENLISRWNGYSLARNSSVGLPLDI
jgi:hypothetical protein